MPGVMLQQRGYSQMHRFHRTLLFQLAIHLQLWDDDNSDNWMGLRTHAFHRDHRVFLSEQYPYSNKFHNRNILLACKRHSNYNAVISSTNNNCHSRQKLPDR